MAGKRTLASISLHIARTAPPADPVMEEPRKLHAGFFVAGLLLSLLAPQTACFLAISFMGLTLPIRDLVEALSVALIAGMLGVGWYGLLALAFSRPSVREVARRSHRVICWAAAALLALWLSIPPCPLFRSTEEAPVFREPVGRFEAILAPDDRWMIFDLIEGLPAEMNGQMFIGLSRRAAFKLERQLNRSACWTKNSGSGGQPHPPE